MANSCNCDNIYIRLFTLSKEYRELEKKSQLQRSYARLMLIKQRQLDYLLAEIDGLLKLLS